MNIGHRVTRNSDSNFTPIERCKNGILTFFQEIGIEVFFICREINHLKIKFWKRNTLVASYLLALVTLEMGLTMDFGHRFNN